MKCFKQTAIPWHQKAGWGNCLPHVWCLCCFPAYQKDECAEKIKNENKNFTTTQSHCLVSFDLPQKNEQVLFYPCCNNNYSI